MSKKTIVCTLIALLGLTAAFAGSDWKSGIPWKKPFVVTPAEKVGNPPSDAVILFDGKDMSAWDHEWVIENGDLVVGKKDLFTKQKFGSVQLHLEFATPAEVKGSGQGRGNSGVFFGNYEVQILDSYENETYPDGQCASIYKQTPPLVNVCRKPGEWQTYDIVYNCPELNIEKDESGKVQSVQVLRPAYITVFQNGVLVVNHHEIKGSTFYNRPPAYEPHEAKVPIKLQDHGNKTRFRNIWVREIPDVNPMPQPVKAAYYE
ncbi:MAG: DUF1080 domain-containing protein [Planctomycetaceae bacterium]|jgi:hypothetical protein|nr:DUF1080 domain-containing protein [Planctomycetaceae bacterium]